MLLTSIITALALVAKTFAYPSSTTSTLSLSVDSGPTIVGGYTPQEKEQIRQAHLDAIKLVRTAISSVSKDQYDRIFVKYFNINDHQLVWDVLTQITKNKLYPANGNMFLNWIYVVPDVPQGVMMEKACDNSKTHLQLRDSGSDHPTLIICPRGFKHGSFVGKIWPGVSDATCDSISPRVSWRMLTLGHFFVQQYTYFQKIERAAMDALGGTTFDLADGLIDVLNIDRYQARVNADSYAWFVTELAWTMHCGEYFEYRWQATMMTRIELTIGVVATIYLHTIS